MEGINMEGKREGDGSAEAASPALRAPEDGGPAFAACAYEGIGGAWTEQIGMSLRDWFAGKAMQSDIAYSGANSITEDRLAAWSYLMADAMLQARKAGV